MIRQACSAAFLRRALRPRSQPVLRKKITIRKGRVLESNYTDSGPQWPRSNPNEIIE
jgi:hypothetical protein